MFSHALRRFVQGFNHFSQSSIRSLNTVVKPNDSLSTPTYGFYDISVTGKVSNIFSFDDGSVAIYIKSTCPGNFTKTHKVSIIRKRLSMIELAKGHVNSGDHVYVTGKLSTQRFKTDDGKNRSTSAIIASQMYIFDKLAVANNSKYSNADLANAIDENSVELAGRITTTVSGTSSFKSFTLASPKTVTASPDNPINFSFNQIFVYDQSLFPLLDDVRLKKDEFFVRGEISYRNYRNKYGKNVPTAYITAKQLYRI